MHSKEMPHHTRIMKFKWHFNIEGGSYVVKTILTTNCKCWCVKCWWLYIHLPKNQFTKCGCFLNSWNKKNPLPMSDPLSISRNSASCSVTYSFFSVYFTVFSKCTGYIATNGWMNENGKLEKYGQKRLWPILRYNTNIYLERLSKISLQNSQPPC